MILKNAAPNSWSNKGTCFNTISKISNIYWLKLGFIPCVIWTFNYPKNRSSHPGVFLIKGVWNLQQSYRRTPMAWEFSSKSAAYFQNTFPEEPLWVAASGIAFFIFPCAEPSLTLRISTASFSRLSWRLSPATLLKKNFAKFLRTSFLEQLRLLLLHRVW